MSRPVLRSHRGFVLHGLFDVPFAEIAPIVGRTSAWPILPIGRRASRCPVNHDTAVSLPERTSS